MNNYFKYGSLEDTPKYSCRNTTLQAATPNVPLGIFYIVAGFTVQVGYLISLLGISRKENIQYPAYKLMFGLAVYDLLNIFVCGYWMGYFTIYGFHFCDKPTLIFWTGLYCGLLFNPDYGTVIFHPLIPENMDHEYNVDNQIYLNRFVCTALGTCSILIYLIQWRKEKIMGLKMGSYRKQVLRQAILVSLFVFTTTLIWTSLAFIPQGPFSMSLMHIGHISWMLMHSTPAMIYLSFNKTIRKNVRRLVGIPQVSRVYHTNGSEVVAPSIP
ncbi:unnamed protein product, partial [Mesorhabditis spiculigera]